MPTICPAMQEVNHTTGAADTAPGSLVSTVSCFCKAVGCLQVHYPVLKLNKQPDLGWPRCGRAAHVERCPTGSYHAHI